MNLFDKACERLQKRADRNGDGKVDMVDVGAVVHQLEQEAREQAQAHPLVALCVAFIGGLTIGFFAGRASK